MLTPTDEARTLPTADEEVWRYSRIAELDLARFTLRAASTLVTAPSPTVSDATSGPGVPSLTIHHGGSRIVGDETGGAEVPSLTVHDVFDELNEAHADPVVIAVRAGRTIAEPITVAHRITAPGSSAFPRLVIHAAPDSDVTVIETFESADDIEALVVPRVQIRAAQSARVQYLAVNLLGRRTWQIGHQEAVGERDSTIQLATVALGGDYARVRTDARSVGQGATTKQVAVYYADGTQMHDFRTLQDHVAPKTNSDLLFKGAVQDTAKSVYTGLIRIGQDAKGTVAFQTNRNLTLSEGAWAESVPNLDIATNDVKCSHASSVGPIDDEQRYYLESRGIPPEVAERLVVLGFFDEVLAQLPVSAEFRAALHRRVADKLDRRQP